MSIVKFLTGLNIEKTNILYYGKNIDGQYFEGLLA